LATVAVSIVVAEVLEVLAYRRYGVEGVPLDPDY
jgi:hypothetical protein